MSEQNEFLKLFLKENRRIFAYILTMIPNHVDAEDVLQETASVLWSKFSDFEPRTSFYAWARQIAKYKVSEYYKHKRPLVFMGPDVLERIEGVGDPILGSLDERMTALRGCLSKLEPRDAKLVHTRFFQQVTLKDLAAQTDQSVHTLYKRMVHIYTVLQVCIKKTLVAWE